MATRFCWRIAQSHIDTVAFAKMKYNTLCSHMGVDPEGTDGDRSYKIWSGVTLISMPPPKKKKKNDSASYVQNYVHLWHCAFNPSLTLRPVLSNSDRVRCWIFFSTRTRTQNFAMTRRYNAAVLIHYLAKALGQLSLATVVIRYMLLIKPTHSR